jgi:hypothetical protein
VLSNGVRSAAVLGCGSPVIALAPAVIDQLNDEDLDRIVIHEWAHVQRRDDIAQMIQRLVRMVAGWHPAVWWLDRHLELEREVACDEMVVAETGSAKGYAVCLATLAAMPGAEVRSLPALSAVSSSGLRRRLDRILAAHRGVSRRPWRAIAACASFAVAALAVAVGNVRVVTPADASFPVATAPVTARMIAAVVSLPAPRVTEADDASRRVVARRVTGDGSTRERRANGPVSHADARSIRESSAPPALTASSQSEVRPVDSSPSLLLATPTAGAQVVALIDTHQAAGRSDGGEPANNKDRAAWDAAADAGVAIGRGSQNAGVATARLFNRFGRKIADSF